MDWDNSWKDGFRYVAYILEDDEKALLVAALKKHIPKLQKKLDRIKMNPRNDESLRWGAKEDSVRDDIRRFKKAIETLESHSNKPK